MIKQKKLETENLMFHGDPQKKLYIMEEQLSPLCIYHFLGKRTQYFLSQNAVEQGPAFPDYSFHLL